MKTFEIYSQQENKEKIDKKSAPLASVEAINEIEALKLWHLHLKSERSHINYFNNICYVAIDRNKPIYDFLDGFKKSNKKYQNIEIIEA